jgi:hypothetical protein
LLNDLKKEVEEDQRNSNISKIENDNKQELISNLENQLKENNE